MEESWQERSMRAAVGPTSNSNPRPAWDRRAWLVAIPLALIVIYAFIPSLANGFVVWDDDKNFLENPYFRGLGLAELNWAWTTFRLGVYQPLAWMLFETQYVFWRLDPHGYHLISLVFQVANAVVLYFLTVTLVCRCRSDSRLENPWLCYLSAGLATTLFAVHPLRVEAVAWVSCQPYLPCILFSMLAVLAYLGAFPMDSSPRWGWLAGSFLLVATAMLFKAVAVSLPAVLLILDVYPLRRIPDETGRWFAASARRAWLEKVPFVVLSLFFMGLALTARTQSTFLVAHYDALDGIAQACYGIWFYIQKTVLPVDIITFYAYPRDLHWLAPPFAMSIIATVATSVGLFLSRRRWPGLLAAWLCYLVILAPNSGIIRNNGHVIAADRYSYMPMLGSVVLAATGLCRLSRMSSRWHPDSPLGIIAMCLGGLLGLTTLTCAQCRTWFDSETLWAHALTHGADTSFLAHGNLGVALQTKGRYDDAMSHYIAALRLNPAYANAHNNLGSVLYTQGKYEEAEAHFAEALRSDPGYDQAHNNLGTMLSRRGKYEEAVAHLTEALRLNPAYGTACNNLGDVLYAQGKYEESVALFAEAIRLQPDDPKAYSAGAKVMAACPDAKFRDGKEAVRWATRACELTQWQNATILDTLAAAQAEFGDFDAAVKSQERAIELLPDEGRKDDYRSRLKLYQTKKPFRQVSPQPAASDGRP